MAENPIYVLDTNILVDYVDIIPGSGGRQPAEPTIDLSEARIVIPSVVVRELSSFKKEKTDRGKAARVALRRLRALSEEEVHPMDCSYGMSVATTLNNDKQEIYILPVHKDFRRCLPFNPAENDMDGQIILTSIAAAMIDLGLQVDGTADKQVVRETMFNNVVLLTNDNGLAIRARERGIQTSRYGYKYPEAYTGRRDIVVPKDVFMEFLSARFMSREFFEEHMPADTPKLIANEFLVMRLEDENDYPPGFYPKEDPYFTFIGRYDFDEDGIVPLKYASDFPIGLDNPGQAIYAECLNNPQFSAVVCTGPAGSGKTYMPTIYGYMACKDGQYIGVTVVPCEGRSNIGALPGDLNDKMDPDVQPIKNALRNFLLSDNQKFRKELENLRKFGTGKAARAACKNGKNGKNGNNGSEDAEDDAPDKRSIKVRLKEQVDLIWDNWFSNIPVESARGRDFAYELAIYDEAQDQNATQMDTLIKRLGAEGKIIITGDVEQIHAPYLDQTNNGLVYAQRLLLGSTRVAQTCFVEEEVIRHPLIREIAERQKAKAPVE